MSVVLKLLDFDFMAAAFGFAAFAVNPCSPSTNAIGDDVVAGLKAIGCCFFHAVLLDKK